MSDNLTDYRYEIEAEERERAQEQQQAMEEGAFHAKYEDDMAEWYAQRQYDYRRYPDKVVLKEALIGCGMDCYDDSINNSLKITTHDNRTVLFVFDDKDDFHHCEVY